MAPSLCPRLRYRRPALLQCPLPSLKAKLSPPAPKPRPAQVLATVAARGARTRAAAAAAAHPVRVQAMPAGQLHLASCSPPRWAGQGGRLGMGRRGGRPPAVPLKIPLPCPIPTCSPARPPPAPQPSSCPATPTQAAERPLAAQWHWQQRAARALVPIWGRLRRWRNRRQAGGRRRLAALAAGGAAADSDSG